MKKQLKLFATDMDGTFLRSDRSFNHEKLTAVLDAFDERGWIFCASSGRQLLALEDMLFHDYKERIAFVAENGGVVTYKGETIFAQTFSHEQVQAVCDLLLSMKYSPKMDFLISGINGSYCLDGVSDTFWEKAKLYYANMQKVAAISDIDDEMIKVTTNFPEEKTAECERFITEKLAFARATTTGFTSIDIGSHGISKASGLAHLLAHFEWHPENLAVFGDQMNDYEMLQYAGTAYAVSNAFPDILDIADEVILSNDDDAVLVQMEKIINEK
ncbi:MULTISPECIES: Cof-type HAD-IIB family hydrolase [unclassified Lactococcus]|uniref:Cof-type HAD-IIB family hydrolase n=1 Tax=unclassified Lactococcus TaxID=2643510 RepID=UPI0011C8FF9D|nr:MULTISPECIES: Cof-type HAD-IIB family hydrolase [unclassified Lactococcus]MQW22711.1 Cof-type HAD-IIB family hydrolase [Lactococcus sp. dk101]TXK44718.1 HAD family hydrolase [Lactococcus sp. dk310]TXK50612.1 HAD family hydrolase [Lactococcus sp. dk322]